MNMATQSGEISISARNKPGHRAQTQRKAQSMGWTHCEQARSVYHGRL